MWFSDGQSGGQGLLVRLGCLVVLMMLTLVTSVVLRLLESPALSWRFLTFCHLDVLLVSFFWHSASSLSV